jgi:hypothetical protein
MNHSDLKMVASTELLSKSGRTTKFMGHKRAELQSVILDMGGSLPGVYLVNTQVDAQLLSTEASAVARQAERDGESPLLVVRTHFSRGVDGGSPYLAADSEQLQSLGALTLAEEFPR